MPLISVALTYGLNQRAARRERHSQVFAEALTAIEDYAEMPYRIRRPPRDLSAQHELTEQISKIQSRIAFHQAWLWIEAPSVAAPYAELVRADESAGRNTDERGLAKPAARKAAHFNLTVAYRRDEINAARSRCIDAMRTRWAGGGCRLPARRVTEPAKPSPPSDHYNWPYSPPMICFALDWLHEASDVLPNSLPLPFGNSIFQSSRWFASSQRIACGYALHGPSEKYRSGTFQSRDSRK